MNSVRVQGAFNIFMIHFWALLLKRVNIFKRDTRGFICEIFLPCIVVVAGLSIMLIQFNFESPPVTLTGENFPKPQNTYFSADTNLVTQQQTEDLMSKFSKEYFNPSYYPAQSILDWDQKNFEEFDIRNRVGAYYLNYLDYTAGQASYTTEVSTVSRSSAPYFVNRMNTALIKEFSNNDNLNIQLTIHPLPLTARIKTFVQTTSGLIAAFMFSIGLSFIPASIITFIVKERGDNVKH